MAENVAPRPLISVHFPKAGGSAFRASLRALFGPDTLLASNEDDPLDPANPYWLHREWFLRHRPRHIAPYLAVHGHLAIARYDLVRSALRVVMLRDPVETLISTYYYWRAGFEASRPGHGVYEFVRREKLSLLETAEIPSLRYLMSRTYFGGYDMSRFDIVGSYDRRQEFRDELSRALGRTLPDEQLVNVTPTSEERGNVKNDRKLTGRLKRLLEDDVRFFEKYTGA
jgi:hypothetical protein